MRKYMVMCINALVPVTKFLHYIGVRLAML